MYVATMVGITILAWILTVDNRIKPKEGGILVGLYISFLVWITFVAISQST
jgi:Ca2+/Na+ antiporter